MSVIALTACNGGDGQSKKQPAVTASTQIQGQIFKGPVAYATVQAFDAIGNYLGETVTDENGFYKLSLDMSYQGVIRIAAVGGNYIDEATGELTPLTETLSAVKALSESEAVMNVTLLTELAAREVSLGMSAEKVARANRHIAESMALDLDIVSEAPVDLLDAAHQGKSGANVDYGLVIAGMTKIAQAEGIGLGRLVNNFRQDFSDNGKLDDPQLLNRLNQGINDFLDSPLNRVGLERGKTSKDKVFYRNTPPVIERLARTSLREGQEHQIAPEITDNKGALSYQWQQVKGPEVQMQGAETAAISFKTPAPETSTVMMFKLTVTDSEGLASEQYYIFDVIPDPVISGVAFKGPLVGATVKVLQLDGTVIGEAITASDGSYRIKNHGFYEGVVIAEVTSGTYVSEATGQTVTLVQPLQAATYTAAKNTKLNITPLTELALRRAKMLGAMLTKENVLQANQDIASVFGLRSSLVLYTPINLLDPSGILQKGDRTEHALAVAAMMVAMNTHSQSLTDWLEQASRDLSDNGRLDDVNLLKALHQGLLDFIRSPLNVLGVTLEDTKLDEGLSGRIPPEIVSVTGKDDLERQMASATVNVKDTAGVSYFWSQVDGPYVRLYNRLSPQVSFRLPDIADNLPQSITLSVTVSRNDLHSSAKITLQAQPYPAVEFDKITDLQLRRCVEERSPKVQDTGDLYRLECGPDYAGISQFDGLAQFVNLGHIGVLAQNQITDVSPLVPLDTLKSLALQQTVLTDLAVLKDLTNLTELFLTQSPWLTDFSALPQLTKLRSIHLNDTGLTDGRIFLQMKALNKIALGKTQITDFSFLQEKTDLISLGVTDSGFTQLESIELAYQPGLRELDISGNPLTDISVLSTLTRLRRVNLSGTKVSDLSALASLKELFSVDASYTEVTDLSAFRSFKSVSIISLQGFKGTDIRPLIDLKKTNRFLSQVVLKGAVQVPCSQMRALQQLSVEIFVDVKPGETCTAN
ncbi:leucine-rich repeat domain-containing protein [Photobacterium sp. 53610]|uniref:leucine-rich repeat domain-containing protein n=1 Tax=Photobacterium sp. 53610 TaxID=3102789 RepID=UPI002ED82F5A